MEAAPAGGLPPSLADAGWFHGARFGMFIHYGLYSLHGCGEWAMYFDKIPAADYNCLAGRFTAAGFDADALADLAKRAGAGYVVFGARHHEGFCLWDTRTTAFNTVKTAAQRDLVREYVVACRRAGLRVGLYYSIMSWQWPAIFSGPARDPQGWKAMVAETHEQVRELMTGYGQIDYLWYDGCVVPGLGDATIRAKHWRSGELNAMVRRLQPGILINDRAALPEDVTTPEQHLTPAPRGRLWECCQTMGAHWGWHRDEQESKTAKELIWQLIFCARHGGNFLLNVGPDGAGRVPDCQVERMEEIGRWMELNGEAIRDSERTSYTEAQHLIGVATCRARTLYFHLPEWPKEPLVIAGVTAPVESVRLLSGGADWAFEQTEDGCVTLRGLPVFTPISSVEVLAVTLSGAPSHQAPPSLLVARDTGRHAPAEAAVNPIESWAMGRVQKLVFDVPATGIYRVELGIVSRQAQALRPALDGRRCSQLLQVDCGNYPLTVGLPKLRLEQGRRVIELEGMRADFGLYLWRLQPVWKLVGVKFWSTIGPFPTEFEPQGDVDQVEAALQRNFPVEGVFNARGSYEGAGGRKVKWTAGKGTEEVVNLALLCGSDQAGVCYARMVVTSPEERDLLVLLGCDWWANLFVNDGLVVSEREPAGFAADGAWFNGWKPQSACVRLRKGGNTFLIKCHPGSTDNWFTFFLNDPGDLEFGA
jgi:alpha-L-fucosidase